MPLSARRTALQPIAPRATLQQVSYLRSQRKNQCWIFGAPFSRSRTTTPQGVRRIATGGGNGFHAAHLIVLWNRNDSPGLLGLGWRGRNAVRSKQPEFQSERVMGEVCLGVAVAGVETLIVMAIAILLM